MMEAHSLEARCWELSLDVLDVSLDVLALEMASAAAIMSSGTLTDDRMDDMDPLDSEDDEPKGGEDVSEAGGEGNAECELGRMTGLILGVGGVEFEGEMYFTGM